jgi:carboxyl-terminal processing protease
MRPFSWCPSWIAPAIVAGILITPVHSAAQQPVTELTLADRVVVATRIYATIQQYFAHWDAAPRAQMEVAYREYIDRAVVADRKDFDLATLRFLATLRNGHTQFIDSRLDGRPLKFRLLSVEGQWVVVDTQDTQLPRGAVVRSLDGKPIDEFVREQARYVAASNDRLAYTHVFSYPTLFPERVKVGLQNGDVVVVDRAVRSDAPEASATPAPQGRWLRDAQLAYIRIPSFSEPAYERTAMEFVRQFVSAPNVIVDVRGNGGGSTPFQLMGALMDRPRRWWQEVTPQRIALFEAQGFPPMQTSRVIRPQPPTAEAYGGRLFLLVDRFCGSACEDFVMPFKDTGRATVIGETTQGSSGNPYRVDLGYGMNITVGAVRYTFPDGTAFEGVGIVPNVGVERTLADVIAGRDAVLERAQAIADAPAR